MTQARFREQIAALTRVLADRPLDTQLDQWLNSAHGPRSATYQALRQG